MDRLFLTVLPSSPALHDHTFPCTCASVQSPKQGKVGRENDATQGSQEVKSTIVSIFYCMYLCNYRGIKHGELYTWRCPGRMYVALSILTTYLQQTYLIHSDRYCTVTDHVPKHDIRTVILERSPSVLLKPTTMLHQHSSTIQAITIDAFFPFKIKLENQIKKSSAHRYIDRSKSIW